MSRPPSWVRERDEAVEVRVGAESTTKAPAVIFRGIVTLNLRGTHILYIESRNTRSTSTSKKISLILR